MKFLLIFLISCNSYINKNKPFDVEFLSEEIRCSLEIDQKELNLEDLLKKVIDRDDLNFFKIVLRDFNLSTSFDNVIISLYDKFGKVEGVTLFSYASHKLSFNIINYLLDYNANPNRRVYKNSLANPFIYFLQASKNNLDIELMKKFILKGADVSYRFGNYECPASVIIKYDNKEALAIFVANGFNIYNEFYFSYTTLGYASQKCSLRCMQYLIDRGCTTELSGRKSNCLGLSINKPESVKLLLRNGIVKYIPYYSPDILSYLSPGRKGSAETLKLLMKYKIDTSFVDAEGRDLFLYAAAGGDKEMLKIYLEEAESKGIKLAKLNTKDKRGFNALIYSVNNKNENDNYNEFCDIKSEKYKDTFLFLLEEGIDPNHRDNESKTVLNFVDTKYIEDVIHLLLTSSKYNFSDCTYVFKTLNGKNDNLLLLYINKMNDFYSSKDINAIDGIKSLYYLHPINKFKNNDVQAGYINLVRSIIKYIYKINYQEESSISIIDYKDILVEISKYF